MWERQTKSNGIYELLTTTTESSQEPASTALVHSWLPYAELVRLQKPAGTLLLYFPCLYGTLLVACINPSKSSPSRLLDTNERLLFGCFLVRSLGCAWNDIIDQDLDRRVARTRSRPIARGAISTSRALAFVAFQLLVGAIISLFLLPSKCLMLGVPSIILTAIYPFSKRFTYYPQFLLGLVFSWGIVIASPAMEPSKSTADWNAAPVARGYLYAACVAWTCLYDTIYAAQDIRDDLAVGIKSTATRYRHCTRHVLRTMGIAMTMCWTAVGVAIGASAEYYAVDILMVAFLGGLVEKVDLRDPSDCAWWFKTGNIFAGVIMAGPLLMEYTARLAQSQIS